MSKHILTKEEMQKVMDETYWDPERTARAIEAAVFEKLKVDGWVCLKPGQVVAEWARIPCHNCGEMPRGLVAVEPEART